MIPEHKIQSFCGKFLSAECPGVCSGCRYEAAALEEMRPVGGNSCTARRNGKKIARPDVCRFCGTCGEVR